MTTMLCREPKTLPQLVARGCLLWRTETTVVLVCVAARQVEMWGMYQPAKELLKKKPVYHHQIASLMYPYSKKVFCIQDAVAWASNGCLRSDPPIRFPTDRASVRPGVNHLGLEPITGAARSRESEDGDAALNVFKTIFRIASRSRI